MRSYYNLRPREIVDITAQWTNPNSFLTLARRPDMAMAPDVQQMFDPVLRVQLKVELNGQGRGDLTVRSRQWVLVPPRQ